MATRVNYPASVVRLLQRAENAAEQNRTALRHFRGEEVQTLTWSDVARDVRRAAAGLLKLGVAPGDRVALVSPNRYEWIVCDLATQLVRGVNVPIHATLSGPQIAWQIADAEPKVLVLGGPDQAARLAGLNALPKGCACVSFDEALKSFDGQSVAPFGEWLATDADEKVLAQLENLQKQIQPDDLATILYTSGSTGEPKGVMLTHANLVSNTLAAALRVEPRQNDVRLCWLPLSHIFARNCDLYSWIESGYELALGRSRETVIADCQEFKPTLLNGVPYFFERVMCLIEGSPDASKPDALSDCLGGRIRLGVSGGAALPSQVANYYLARGVPLVQGYGLTETAPVITFGSIERNRVGSVGPAIEGVEVRISDAGEILTRGPHVMQGYWKKPRETAEVIREGWFHTGDIGRIDDDGFLFITGRIKEIIVTAGGKKVAPVAIEALLADDPFIQQVVVMGEGRKFLSAIVAPRCDQLAKALALACDDGEVCRNPRAVEFLQRRIDERLKSAVSEYEQIRRILLTPYPFSLDREELTPTLKLRRGVIAEHYKCEIDALYAGAPLENVEAARN